MSGCGHKVGEVAGVLSLECVRCFVLFLAVVGVVTRSHCVFG